MIVTGSRLKAAMPVETQRARINRQLSKPTNQTVPDEDIDDDIRKDIPDVARLAPLARLWAKMQTRWRNGEPNTIPRQPEINVATTPISSQPAVHELPSLLPGYEYFHQPEPVESPVESPSQTNYESNNQVTRTLRSSSHAPPIIRQGVAKTIETMARTSSTAKVEKSDEAYSDNEIDESGKDSGISMGQDNMFSMVSRSSIVDGICKPPEVRGNEENPSETAPEHGSWRESFSTVTKEPVIAAPSRSAPAVPVEVLVSKLERVRTLKFAPSRTINAREISVSERDKDKLRSFSSFVGPANQIVLFGRRLPQCHRYLVEIEEDEKFSATYICIEGLVKGADIKDFHMVMSQRSCRKFYEPWKLCFKRCEVSSASAASCQIHVDEDNATLCGALLNNGIDGNSCISTIGGLIEVDGSLFAMTTSHPPPISREERVQGPFTNSIGTLSENDFPDYVESALVITLDDTYSIESGTSISRSSTRSWSDGLTIAEEGDDWRLLTVSGEHKLPNLIGSLSSDISRGPLETSVQYITEYTRSPSAISVVIKAGVSGYHQGITSLDSSYMDGMDEPREVWVVTLDNSDLVSGDSGSWVLDVTNQTNYKVAGTVVARSPRKAYFTLISEQFSQIQEQSPGPPRNVTLPSPLLLLLDLAKRFYSTKPELAQKYIKQLSLLLDEANHLSTPLSHALKAAFVDAELSQQDVLNHIFFEHGSNLGSILNNFDSQAHRTEHRRTYDLLAQVFRKFSIPKPSDLADSGNSFPLEIQPCQDQQQLTVQHNLPIEKHSENPASQTGTFGADGVIDTNNPRTENDPARNDERIEYSSGFTLVLTIAALTISFYLLGLNEIMVGTAIPTITDEFEGIQDVPWYGSAYAITSGIFQPIWIKAYKYFPLKITFLVATGTFGLGSLICGVSSTSTTFIIGRAITGMGDCGIGYGAYTIIDFTAEPEKRRNLTTILGVSIGLGSAFGPLISGVLSDKASWRWCFYVNLILCGLVAAIIAILFRTPKHAKPIAATIYEKYSQLNLLSTIFALGGMVAYTLALQYGGNTHPWNSSVTIGLLIGFALLIIASVICEYKRLEKATFSLRLMARHVVWSNAMFGMLFCGSYNIIIYYLPLYFQSIDNTSSTTSGIRNLAFTISFLLSAIVAEMGISGTGLSTLVMVLGATVASVGTGLLYTLDVGTASSKWIGYQVIAGVGWGLASQVPRVSAEGKTNVRDFEAVSVIISTFQSIGGALLISAAQAAFINQLLVKLRTAVPDVDPFDVIATGATQLREVFHENQISGIIEAYTDGLRAAFLVCIGALAISFLLSLASDWKRLNIRS